MHIVQLLTHSTYGGGQQVVYLLVSVFHRRYPDVKQTVVLPEGGVYGDRFRSLNVSVIELPLDTLSPLNIPRVLGIARSLSPDVIHSHGKGAGFHLRVIPSLANGVPRVHSYHGFHPPSQQVVSGIYFFLEDFLLRHTTMIVNVSQSERERIITHFPSAEQKSMVIPNIVDVEEIRTRAKEKLPEPLRSFVDQSKEGFLVTMIGRDDPLKNYPLALDAAEKLLESDPRFRFIFVGINPDSYTTDRLTKQYIGRLLVIPNLDNTASLIANSDLLMLPSKREGSPLVILEAFALGKPFVGTNTDGIRDLIQHEVNGLLCEQSPDSLSHMISRIGNDTKLYQMLSRGAASSGNRMDLNAWGDAYYHLYTSIVDRR